MVEIFGDIINSIEETFIEVRNGLQNRLIAQKCKNLGNEKEFEEDRFFPDSAKGRMARIRANGQERADGT